MTAGILTVRYGTHGYLGQADDDAYNQKALLCGRDNGVAVASASGYARPVYREDTYELAQPLSGCSYPAIVGVGCKPSRGLNHQAAQPSGDETPFATDLQNISPPWVGNVIQGCPDVTRLSQMQANSCCFCTCAG